MSLKANIGFSRKIGEPHFSSRGASINLEFELDTSLLENPAQLLERIHESFELARTAVDAELSGANPHRCDQHVESLSSGPAYGLAPLSFSLSIRN